MAVGRAERRAERAPLVESVLGADEDAVRSALNLLELVEIAWHDVHGEATPPDDVILNILICSEGQLDKMIDPARLAVEDWRDLQVWAEEIQSGTE